MPFAIRDFPKDCGSGRLRSRNFCIPEKMNRAAAPDRPEFGQISGARQSTGAEKIDIWYMFVNILVYTNYAKRPLYGAISEDRRCA